MASTYVAETYTEASEAVDRMVASVTAGVIKAKTAVQMINDVTAELAQLATGAPNGWLETAQYINAQAAANPSDPVWQDLKAKKDKVLADYQAVRTHYLAVITAIEGV